MIITTWLVATVLAVPAVAAPSSDAAFEASAAAVSTQVSAIFQTASWNEVDTLLDLLSDKDPEVRRQAVRSLKIWVSQRTSTRDRVLDLFRNRNEDLAVRREAAKTLSVVSTYNVVHDALLAEARRSGDDTLRAISYKALYWMAAQRSDIRNALIDAARREAQPSIRRAAIWGLFASSNDNRTQEALEDIARRDSDAEVRAEALKSLYGGMGSNDVRGLAFDLARDINTPSAVRRAAILMHAARVQSTQRDLLERIARQDADPAMRAAAITALGNPRSEEILSFFHLVRRDNNGVMVSDPLDAE